MSNSYVQTITDQTITDQTITEQTITDQIITDQNANHSNEPTTSSNPLCDVIRWLKEDIIVILHNKYGQIQIYHNKCSSTQNIYNNKICCVECNTVPGILDKDEWDIYIEEENNRCSCKIDLAKINKLINTGASNIHIFSV
jgi:hypothetical protein